MVARPVRRTEMKERCQGRRIVGRKYSCGREEVKGRSKDQMSNQRKVGKACISLHSYFSCWLNCSYGYSAVHQSTSYLLGYKIHIECNTQKTNQENDHHRLILGDIGRFVNSASRSNDMGIDRSSRPFRDYIRFRIERNHLGSVRRLTRCRFWFLILVGRTSRLEVFGMSIDPFFQCA